MLPTSQYQLKLPPDNLLYQGMYILRSCDEPDLVVIIQAHDEHVLGGAIQVLPVLEENAVCSALCADVGHYGIVVP